MSAPPPANAARRPVHLRRIECAGFARDDGLFDIEGTLIDTKPTPLDLPEHHVPAHAPIHHMRLRLTVDSGFLIREVEAQTVQAPYGVCGRIAPAYSQLVGQRIEAGFTQKVKRMFRGVEGCSHLTELLPVMATTAFQIIWAEGGNFDHTGAGEGSARGSPLGGCHALRLDGEVVLRHFRHMLPAAAPAKD